MIDIRDELQKRIERYRLFAVQGLDPLTTERIVRLVADLEQQLAALDRK